MRRYLRKLADRLELAAYRDGEVARCGNIGISDILQKRTRFGDCILASLELVKSCDPSRYHRIQRRLSWIVNCPLEKVWMAQYRHGFRACEIDFDERDYVANLELHVAWCASTLVHEATHGAIDARGIRYTPEMRSRIEQLCVAEEHRFLDHLAVSQPEMAQDLRSDFSESDWHWSWNAGRTAKLFRTLRRIFSKCCRPVSRNPQSE